MAITQRRNAVSDTGARPAIASMRGARRILWSLEWRLTFLLAAMGGVAIFFGSLNRYYVTLPNFLDMGRQASLLVVAAIGANLIIVAGEIDLSVGAVVGLVSVAVPGLFDLGFPMPAVLLFALVIGAIVGAANGAITLRLMVPSFLATLGVMAIVRGIAISISDQPRQVLDESFGNIFNSSIAAFRRFYSFHSD